MKERSSKRSGTVYNTAWIFAKYRDSIHIYDEIQDAFHYSGVLSAFGFLDPRNLPSDVEYLHDYGEVCIELMKIQLLIYQINLKLHFFITDSQVK
jgi:hypothetical protein